MTMNYPYGLQPRTFLLSKRDWAADTARTSTVRATASRPLALTSGPMQKRALDLQGRTQILPHPPGDPLKRGHPTRSFQSVTDWSVSAPSGPDAHNVYGPRKQHHLPPIEGRCSSHSGQSSAVRARSLIRANQQASLRYEMAVESAERETLEQEELRARQLQQEQIASQVYLLEEVKKAEKVNSAAPAEELSLHTLYEEEVKTCLPMSPTSNEKQPENSAHAAPPLCACNCWETVEQCRSDVARALVDGVLSFLENGRDISSGPDEDTQQVREVARDEKVAQTPRSINCACAAPHDIDECRSQQAEELVALVLSRVSPTQTSRSAGPQDPGDLAELRQREAEAFVNSLLESIPVPPATVCTCHSEEDVRGCRERFLGCMVDDALAGYV